MITVTTTIVSTINEVGDDMDDIRASHLIEVSTNPEDVPESLTRAVALSAVEATRTAISSEWR